MNSRTDEQCLKTKLKNGYIRLFRRLFVIALVLFIGYAALFILKAKEARISTAFCCGSFFCIVATWVLKGAVTWINQEDDKGDREK
jgi:hypothetical protein